MHALLGAQALGAQACIIRGAQALGAQADQASKLIKMKLQCTFGIGY